MFTFVGQSNLVIDLAVTADIAGSSVAVGYRKPSGMTGSWAGTIQTANPGVVRYSVTDTSVLNEPGTWVLWAIVTFGGGAIGYGTPAELEVREVGR